MVGVWWGRGEGGEVGEWWWSVGVWFGLGRPGGVQYICLRKSVLS